MKLTTQIDGAERLGRDIDMTRKDIQRAVKRAVDKTALAVESDAKRKLRDDGHVITARLMSSIHAETQEGKFSYRDKNGHTFDGSLGEQIAEDEAIAGTNVEYGPKIESTDSFLGWAAIKQGKKLVDRIKSELSKIKT